MFVLAAMRRLDVASIVGIFFCLSWSSSPLLSSFILTGDVEVRVDGEGRSIRRVLWLRNSVVREEQMDGFGCVVNKIPLHEMGET